MTPITDPAIVSAVERVLVGAVGLTALAIAEAPEAVDLTLPQWRALAIVGGGDGVRVGELASRLHSAVPSTSRLVRRLEGHGLVTAERDERDRRATLVRASRAGVRVREAVLRRRRELIAETLESSAPHATRPTLAALTAIADALGRFA